MIPYGRQDISQSDIDAVTKVLSSDYLTQGPVIGKFESALATNVGATYAVAVNSATSALHLACLALGLRKGDYLWTTPITFVASANCGLYCGAKVDFVDIDPDTYNISIEALSVKLIEAEKLGLLPKVLIPVHLAGQPCDMIAIHKLSKQYGFKIIEDASHAIGGKYLDKPIGGCQYSDITVFSFHPVKIITTAEGGLATTNDVKLLERMQLFRSHGVTRKQSLMTSQFEGGWYYQQVDLGYNYRMTDLQATLGVSQMQRLDEFITNRHTLQERYDQLLSNLPIVKPYQNQDSFSALHLYPIQLDLNIVDKSRQQVFDELRKNGIGVNVHYIPLHTQPYYQNMGFIKGDFPNSENYYENTISLPLFQRMTFEQQNEVVKVLKDILE